MAGTGRRMLIIGAVLVACVSAFHVACAIVGSAAYRYLGAGEGMASAAASGSAWPALLTLGLAAVFGLFSLYGFAAAGRMRPLPLLRTVIIFSGIVFALRGLGIVGDIVGFARVGEVVALRNLFYSGIALLIGLLYLLGLALRSRRSSRTAVA